MKKTPFLIVFALVTVFASPLQAADWEPLFPADSTEGWETQGPGEWALDAGVLSVKVDSVQESYLISPSDYGDFELRFEFQIPGMQFANLLLRTHPLLEGPQYFGYACEVQAFANTGAGPLSNAPGLGNLVKTQTSTLLFSRKLPLSRAKGDAAQINQSRKEWNQLLVRCIQDKLEVEYNGTLINSTTDDQYLSGKIALMVQSGLGGEVLFRNLEMRDLSSQKGYQSLFNGENFEGWKIHGDAEQWRVEEGIILSESNAKEYSYLATEKEYKNFSAIAEFQGLAGGNSGLFFHSHLDGTRISGIQAEVQPPTAERLGHSGCLYDASGRGWLIEPTSLRPEQEAVFRMDDWNTIRVDVIDHHIKTWLNGLQIADYQDENPKHDQGVLALQLHSGELVKVNWRNIRVKSFD